MGRVLSRRGRRAGEAAAALARHAAARDGFGTDLWKQFAELGLNGICIPESHGGMGLGATEAALVLEEIGRNLTPSPFLMTGVAAARAIEGTAHAERWYPAVLSGEAVLALAVDEGPRHDPEADRARGEAAGQRLRARTAPSSSWSRAPRRT